MNSLEFVRSLGQLDTVIRLIETSFIILYTYIMFIKVSNIKPINSKNIIVILLSIPVISIITIKLKDEVDLYHSSLAMIILITITNLINFKKNIGYSILVTILSLSFNYLLYYISLTITFIPSFLLKIQNDYISLIIIIIIYSILILGIFKLKKFKYGISFLQNKLKDSYFNVLILNIGIIMLFLIMIIQDRTLMKLRKPALTFIIFAISMFVTIKQSFDLYYKHNLLTKDLEETKAELEKKTQELEKSERDNLNTSEEMHTLAHRQKILKYRVNKLIESGNINSEEINSIKEEMDNISKDMYKEPTAIELSKTDIPTIDIALECMQDECVKNNIKFELQVIGNIHYMVNNLISEDDLEILLADHIKDAMIAINHTDNTNKSILVRLGKIDESYGIYIYDTGIEFTEEVLEKLGKEPITTHKESGGTGLGFMNTFKTLEKTKASLIINEIGKPSTDNYTKAVVIRFDGKQEYRIETYKKQEINV